MKKGFSVPLALAIMLVLSIIACQKPIVPPPTEDERDHTVQAHAKRVPHTDSLHNDSTQHPPGDTTQHPVDTVQQHVPYPETVNFGCPGGPSYGDSVIFLQPTSPGQDYVVQPVNNPGPGKYFSWPEGMVIDPNTGAINVSQSETGVRYNVGFVKEAGDTCLQTLILGGAAYVDSVYVMADDQTKANPYYNANIFLPPVCTGGSGCQYDVTGEAARKRISIDRQTGIIDLKQTYNNGVFSLLGLIPLDGTSVDATIYYRLNDRSNMALQKTTLTLMFYNRKRDIPPSLLGNIDGRKDNLLQSLLLTLLGRPKPNLIIITRYE